MNPKYQCTKFITSKISVNIQAHYFKHADLHKTSDYLLAQDNFSLEMKIKNHFHLNYQKLLARNYFIHLQELRMKLKTYLQEFVS